MSQYHQLFIRGTQWFGLLALVVLIAQVRADPPVQDLQAIDNKIESGDLSGAYQQLRALRNQHFPGLAIQGKTCQNHPALILMVAAESKLRQKNAGLAANYLRQLQCLASVGEEAVGVKSRLEQLRGYEGFTPRRAHECPHELGKAQLHAARQLAADNKPARAMNEAMRAACLLGVGSPEVTALLNALGPIAGDRRQPQQAPSKSEQLPEQQRQAESSALRQPGSDTSASPPAASAALQTASNTSQADWLMPLGVVVAVIILLLVLLLMRKRKNEAALFISYRRSDSAGWAQNIHDRLAAERGHEYVFMDLHDIPPGTDFVQHLDQTLKDVKTVIVVIGPNWEAGERINNAGDWVRQEVVYALEQNKQVIPVLVDHRQMPSAQNLPEDLHPLLRHNAITLYPEQLDAGMKRLLKVL